MSLFMNIPMDETLELAVKLISEVKLILKISRSKLWNGFFCTTKINFCSKG